MINKYFAKIFPKRFGNYWDKIKDNHNIDKDLKFITSRFINSESYKFVSNQWHLYNIMSYKSLIKNGIENYGSEISTHYFTFKDYENDYLNNLDNQNFELAQYLKINFLKKHDGFNQKQSVLYNALCVMLYSNLKKTTYFKYLKLLNNKTYIGYNDPYVEIEEYKICSDKLISLFDYETIEKFSSIKEHDRILEIGSGSGRLSECILSIKNNLNYTICEIPPSIYISYKRLKKAFPDKKIKLLIDYEEKKDLAEQIKKNDISLIFPHQLNILNEKIFDIALAIDCLHEMDKKTIRKYFNNISKNSRKMYFSIWKKTKNWNSATLLKKTERLNFDKGDYPVPSSWKNTFKESLKFPSTYYGIGYEFD